VDIDTGDLGELVRQVAALTGQVGAMSRRLSCLTGRVTIMGSHLHRLADAVEDKMDALLRLVAIFGGVTAPGRPAPKHAAARDRHGLHPVSGGRQ